MIDVDQHDGDGKAIALGVLPEPSHLLFQSGSVQQAGQAVVHRHFCQPAPLEERYAVSVFEGIAARRADHVCAQQHIGLVDGHGVRDVSGKRRRYVRSQDYDVSPKRRAERQTQHRIEIEDGEQ